MLSFKIIVCVKSLTFLPKSADKKQDHTNTDIGKHYTHPYLVRQGFHE